MWHFDFQFKRCTECLDQFVINDSIELSLKFLGRFKK
jgi:hypothetical protein